MKRAVVLPVVSVTLGLLLVLSNLWWAYTRLDTAVTIAYRDGEMARTSKALSEALRVLPLTSRPLTRTQLKPLVAPLFSPGDVFEKEGRLHAGELTFSFDAAGTLVEVAAAGLSSSPPSDSEP